MSTPVIRWWLETHEVTAEESDPDDIARAYLDGDTCVCCGEAPPA